MSSTYPASSSNPTADPPPPSYNDTTHRLSITDLRNQILANASILRPKVNTNRPSDDHLEVTMARYRAQAPDTNNTAAGGRSGSDYKYYAILVTRHRGSSASLNVVIKGEPQADERSALEWLLAVTEDRMHRIVQTSSKTSDEDCVVM